MHPTDQRRLAAIMFTDIVRYSTLVQRNEALMLSLLKEHNQLLRPLFVQHGGEEIKGTGDGFLLEFPSALAAVQCAIEIQRTLAAYNATVQEERRIHVRIGVHVGDVVHTDGDVLGDGVNIAARIEPLAEPDGICISQQVFDQITNQLPTPTIRLGRGTLKNIEIAGAVYKLVLPWQKPQHPFAARINFQQRQARTRRHLAELALGVLAVTVASGWAWHRSVRSKHEGPAAQVTRSQNKPLSKQPDQLGSQETEASLEEVTFPELAMSIYALSAKALTIRPRGHFFLTDPNASNPTAVIASGEMRLTPWMGDNLILVDTDSPTIVTAEFLDSSKLVPLLKKGTLKLRVVLHPTQGDDIIASNLPFTRGFLQKHSDATAQPINVPESIEGK